MTTRDKPTTSSADSSSANPVQPPTIEQVAWVFERLNLALDRRVTFRFLIYDLMGFGLDAYKPLYLAGGMNIINALYTDEELEKEQAMQRQEVLAELRSWLIGEGCICAEDLKRKLEELNAKRPASKAGK